MNIIVLEYGKINIEQSGPNNRIAPQVAANVRTRIPRCACSIAKCCICSRHRHKTQTAYVEVDKSVTVIGSDKALRRATSVDVWWLVGREDFSRNVHRIVKGRQRGRF